MTTATLTQRARKHLATIFQRKTELEDEHQMQEMQQHIEERAHLRDEWSEQEARNEQLRESREQHRAELKKLSERSKEWRESLEGRRENERLCKLANRKPAYRNSADASRHRLISGCQNPVLQNQHKQLTQYLKRVNSAQTRGMQHGQKITEHVEMAQRDLTATWGRIRKDYGPEGQRWRKIRKNGMYVIEAVGQGRVIHEDNIDWMNKALRSRQRRIMQLNANYVTVHHDTKTEVQEQLASLEQTMIDSEI